MKLIDKVDVFLRQEAHKYTNPDALASLVEDAIKCRCFACDMRSRDSVGFMVHHATINRSQGRFAGVTYMPSSLMKQVVLPEGFAAWKVGDARPGNEDGYDDVEIINRSGMVLKGCVKGFCWTEMDNKFSEIVGYRLF